MRKWKFPLVGAVAGAVIAGTGYGLEGLDPWAYTVFGIGLMACFVWRVHSRRRHEDRMEKLLRRYTDLAREQAKLEAGNA